MYINLLFKNKNMKGYYKKIDGKVVELEQQDELYLYGMNIIELIIPEGSNTFKLNDVKY